MFTAILAWIRSKKTFLKVQSGTGDNLLKEDIREGYVDYCLWSTFRPDCIDIDDELDMMCLDSGMFLFRDYPTRWPRCAPATPKPSTTHTTKAT